MPPHDPQAGSGAVLSMSDGPNGCDTVFEVTWAMFRMIRMYLAFRLDEIRRIYNMLVHAVECCTVHGLHSVTHS